MMMMQSKVCNMFFSLSICFTVFILAQTGRSQSTDIEGGITITAEPASLVLCVGRDGSMTFTQEFNFELPQIKAEVMDDTCIDEQRIVITWGDAGDGSITSIRIDGGNPITTNQTGDPNTGKPEVKFEDQRSKVTIKKTRNMNIPCADSDKGKDAIIKIIEVTGRFANTSETFEDKTITMKSEIDITKRIDGNDFKFTVKGEIEAKATAVNIAFEAVGDKFTGRPALRTNADPATQSLEADRVYQSRSDSGAATSGPLCITWFRLQVTPKEIPKESAQQLQQSVRFRATAIDNSDADRDFNRRTGQGRERVEMRWNCPANSTNCNIRDPNANNSEGQPDFNDRTYDAKEGKLFVQLIYLGLPLLNSEFGPKEAAVLCEGTPIGGDNSTIAFQVFFNRNATNHADVAGANANENANSAANWFFYWSQNQRGPMSEGACQYNFNRTEPTLLWAEKGPAKSRGQAFSQQNSTRLFNAAAAPFGEGGFDAGAGGGPMARRDGMVWIIAGWSTDEETGLVNVVFTHEITHVRTQLASVDVQDDMDRDGVPDAAETTVGLLVQMMGGMPVTSFETFKGSLVEGGNPTARDQEYYAWINACFSEDFDGFYRQATFPQRQNQRPDDDQFQDVPATMYTAGVIPDAPEPDEDWAVDGHNFDQEEEEE